MRLVPYNQTMEEMILSVEVPRTGTIINLVTEISKMVRNTTITEQLVVTKVENHHFRKFFASQDLLEEIDDGDDICV